MQNTGNVTVSDITVTDDKTGLNQTIASLAPGASQTYTTTTYTITEADILNGRVVNNATAMGTPVRGTGVTDSTPATVQTVEKNAKLTVTKTTNKIDEANLGEEISYTITVKNEGNVTVSGITVTDPKTSLNETIASLAPGASTEYTTTHTITEADILAGSFENTATATGKDPKGGDVTGSDDETVKTVEKNAALTVGKTVTSTAPDGGYGVGAEITYNVKVTNSGNVTVSDITVNDEKTDDSWTIKTLTPNASDEHTVTYTVTQADVDEGQIVNTATATGTDPDGGNVTKRDSVTVNTVEQAPELTVEKKADKTADVDLNNEITYTITVTNSGNVTVKDITVTDPLTGLNQSVGTLAPKASANVTTMHTITEADIEAGKVENTATATGTDPKGSEVTNSGNETVTTVDQAPALTVVKTANKTEGAVLGEEITYTITVTNSGNVTVSDITVTDPLTGLEKSVGTLTQGASTSVTTTHTITEADILAGSFVNTATAAGTDPKNDEVSDSDNETVTTVEQAPALTVVKTADKTGGGDANLNDVITYTITVTNSGNETVSDITVTDPLTDLEQGVGTLAPGASAEAITTTYTVREKDILSGKVENTATATGTDPNGEEVSGSDDVTVTTATQAPALTVEKKANKTSGAALNDVITYTITVTNSGNETVSDITVTDPLTGLEKSVGTLAPGASAETITTTYTVQEKDIIAGKIENTATATGTDPNGDEVTSSDNETVMTVEQVPALTVEKKANKTSGVALDEEISYTISVTNSGNVTVSDITVTDSLTGLNQSVGTLAPEASTSVTTTHTITAEDIAAGQFENTATASGADPNGEEVSGSGSSTVTTVEAAPSLTVEKKADKTSGAALNDVITYTITVKNSGNVTVKDITVTDPLTGLNQSVSALAPGESAEAITTTYTVQEKDILAGKIENTATAKGTDPKGKEVTNSGSATVTTAEQNPVLTVEKTASKTEGAALGEEITYTITVTNSGNVTVSDITVTDPLTELEESVGTLAPGKDASVTTKHTITEADILAGSFVNTATATGTDPNGEEVTKSGSATVTTVEENPALTVEKTANKTSGVALGEGITYTITVKNDGNVTVSGITVTDPLTGLEESAGTLAPNASTSVTTTHTITEADILVGSFENTATAAGTDPNGGEVTNSDDEIVTTAAQAPALTVVKTADKTTDVALNEEITYTITVTNSGNVTVSDITVTDPLTGLEESAGTLAPGEDASVTTKHKITEADILEGSFVNTATAKGTDPNGGEVTNSGSATVTTAVPAPALTVEKTADKISGAALGEEITYSITVTNNGNVTVSDITVTDPKTGLEESAGTLAPGEDASVTTKHKITEADILEGSFVNTATAKGTDPNGGEVSGEDDETVTTVEENPALTVEKTANKTSGAALGEEITYTITVTNSGNVTVSDVTVTDPKTGLEESVGTLAPGESAEAITTTYAVQEADILAGSFENTATAKGTDPKDGEVTGSDDETVSTVAQAPALTVEKTADKTTGAELNDVITYTITVTNSGNVTVSDITVTDPLTGLEGSAGTLAPGEDASVTTKHTITEADILAGSFENTATAAGTDPNGGEVIGSDDETVTTVKPAPALTVNVRVNKASDEALGEMVTYTITVTNSGNVTVRDITVTDPLTGLNQNVGTLAPGASAEATTTYTVQEKDILAGKIENTATATGTDPNGKDVTGSGNATVATVDAAPALTVEKKADKTSGAELNDVITYTITVTNSGNETVNHITVTDPLTGLEKSVGSLAPGKDASVTTTHTITEADILAGSFENTATAAGTDPKGGEVTSSDDETVTTVEQAPALTVEKTADKTSGAALGEKITYTITVTNSGNVTVSDITVTDPKTGLKESAGTLAPGASKEYTTTHTITEEDILAGSFENIATAKGTDPKSEEVTGSDDETVTTAEQASALTVEKTANKTSGAALDEEIAYTITVTNSGNVTVEDITVTDPKTGLEESVDTLAPNASASVTTTHKITEKDIIAGSFVNTATATGTDPNGGEVNGSDDETVTTVAQNPELTVKKTADKTEGAALGEEITYTITVTNSGNETVSDITVTDPLTGLNQSVGTLAPGASAAAIATKYTVQEVDIRAGKIENTATAAGKAPKGGDVTGEGKATVTTVAQAPALTVEKKADKTTGAELNDVITYTIAVTNSGNVTVRDITVTDPKTGLELSVGTLAPGEDTSVTTTHKITAEDIAEGQFENTATAKGTDPNGEEVTGSGNATVTTVDAAPALTVEKKADKAGDAALGEEISYAITVTNSGNVIVSDITVTDKKTGFEQSVGALAPGEDASVTTKYTIAEADILAGSFVNTATATGKGPKGGEVTDSDDETVTTVAQAPALTVVKTADRTSGAELNDVITYTITVKNDGNVTVSDITVTDPKTGLEESAGTLAANASTSVTTTHKITEADILAGSFENTATTTGTDPNGGEVNGSDDETVTTVAQAPALKVEVSANKTSHEELGETVTYTIKVTNSGNVTVSDITVTDPLTGLVRNIGTLAPGENASVTTTHKTTEDNILAGKIENTATATGTDPKGGKVAGSDSATVRTVEAAPALTVEKSADETSDANLNDVITYTIKVTNSGNETVNHIIVTDPLTGLEKSVGSLAPGKEASVTTMHAITEADILAGSFVNTATATGTDPSGKPVTDSDDETVTTVKENPAWTVEKSVSGTTGADGKARIGDVLTYTVTVENTGNTNLSNLTLTDEFSVDGVMKNDALSWTEGNPAEAFDLAPGATKMFTATYTVQATDNNLNNTATVGDETTTIPTPVEDKDAWTVTETVEGATGADGKAVVGDVLTYTVTVENTGNTDLTGLTLTDEFIVDGVVKNNALTWAEGSDSAQAFDLAQGEMKTFTATYTVQATDKELSNTAKTDDDHSTTIPTEVEDNPGLTVEKTADKKSGAALGEEITYTITVTNSGNVTVSGITVTDSKTGLEQSVGTLAPGASTKAITTTYTVTEDDILAGVVTNTATAAGIDPDGGEVTNSDTETVATAVKYSHVTIEKSITSTVPKGQSGYDLGDTIAYEIAVTNDGNLTATDITVTDELTGDVGENAWTIGSLAPGESKTFTTEYEVTEGDILAGGVVNVATATGASIAPDAPLTVYPGEAEAQTATESARLKISKSITSTVPEGQSGYDLGDTITYEIVVKNVGDLTETDITVTDKLTGNVGENAWTIGSLAPGASRTFTAEYKVTEEDILAGSVVNVATATGASIDPDESLTVYPGDVEVQTEIRTPGLAVTMSAPAGPYGVGDAIPYTIAATNTGNVTLTGVIVNDPLTGLAQRVGSMVPGASATVKTSYTVTAADAAAGSVTNTATVTGSDPDGNPVTQSCSAVTVISQQRVTLTVNYWYGEVGGVIAAPSFSATYFAGAAYHVVSPIVAGYNPSRATVTGTITHDATFDVVYTALSYTLTIHYVYEDGTMAAAAYTDTLSIGDAYTVTSPVIEGYTASDTVVAGTMPGRNVTITVIYVSEATALLTDERGTSLHIGNVTMNVGECFE